MNIQNIYDQLNNEKVVGMYYKILNDIINGTLSDIMFDEVNLLRSIASDRGISLSYYRFINKSPQLLVLIRSSK